MAAVAEDQALAEYRSAQLASMAYGVLDVALTGLDWALTASDVVDVVSLAAGPPALGVKAGKLAMKGSVRRARNYFRQRAADALQGALAAAEKLKTVARPKAGSAKLNGAGKPFPRSVKDQAEQMASGRCVFCNVRTEKITGPNKRHTDHAIPASRGGDNSLENAQNACRTCNLRKGAKTTTEFLGP
jgi:hypothetical protein